MAKGSPTEKKSLFIWALPVWGGGLNPCQDGLWHLCIFRRNVHVQTGNRCHGVPVWQRGERVQWLFGQCPNEQLYLYVGASLRGAWIWLKRWSPRVSEIVCEHDCNCCHAHHLRKRWPWVNIRRYCSTLGLQKKLSSLFLSDPGAWGPIFVSRCL